MSSLIALLIYTPDSSFVIEVDLNSTVADIKQEISTIIDRSYSSIKLLYNFLPLSDNDDLKSLNIVDYSPIYVHFNPPRPNTSDILENEQEKRNNFEDQTSLDEKSKSTEQAKNIEPNQQEIISPSSKRPFIASHSKYSEDEDEYTYEYIYDYEYDDEIELEPHDPDSVFSPNKTQKINKAPKYMNFPEPFNLLAGYDSSEKVTIRSQATSCVINKSLALAISQKILMAFNQNPTLNEISLPINDNIEEFFKGNYIDNDFFLKMSIILDSKALLNHWKKENNINKNNVIDYLLKVHSYNGKLENMNDEFKIVGKYFRELKKSKQFDSLPNQLLCEIFKRVEGVESEEEIYHYIKKRLVGEKDKTIRNKLINCVQMEGLDNKKIGKLLKYVEYEELTKALFLRLKDIFLSKGEENTSAKPQKEKPKEKPLKETSHHAHVYKKRSARTSKVKTREKSKGYDKYNQIDSGS